MASPAIVVLGSTGAQEVRNRNSTRVWITLESPPIDILIRKLDHRAQATHRQGHASFSMSASHPAGQRSGVLSALGRRVVPTSLADGAELDAAVESLAQITTSRPSPTEASLLNFSPVAKGYRLLAPVPRCRTFLRKSRQNTPVVHEHVVRHTYPTVS